MNGKDHASARYIFTRLEKITRAIFHPDDDALLKYLNDDGLSIEPEYYMPVIPLVLVNGTEGIGTGYSSSVPSHDPREVIANLRKMINGEDPEMIHPCYYGFTGDIMIENTEGKYRITGKVERKDDTTLIISELPIGKSTQDYKTFLEEMMTGTDKSPSLISDFKENHTDTTVAFTITATKENIDGFENSKDGLVGKFKLSTTISTNNMTLFDVDGKIHKYKTSVDILRFFFNHRLEFYSKRKDMLLNKMRKELKVLENKARFVEEVCKGELVVSNRKRAELLSELSERGYDVYPKDEKKVEEDDENSDDEVEESATDAELAKGYEYLLGMKIWSLTFERAEELRRQRKEKAVEVDTLEGTSPESIWLTDLDSIDEALNERDADIASALQDEVKAQSKSKAHVTKKAAAAAKIAKKAKKKADEWDSDLEDDDSDDDFMVSKSKPAPKPKAKKPVVPVVKAAPVATVAPVVKAPAPAPKEDVVSVLEKLSISDDKPAPVAKKAAPKTKKAATKKAPAKKKAPPKKTYDSDSDDFMGESDSDDSVEIVAAPPRARSGRAAAKKITYVLSDSDIEDSDESFDEDF